MRKIIFRGKLVADSKAFKGYKKDSFAYGGIYKEADKWYIVAHFNVFEVIPDTVSQFTGLVDRNGKEIYEGDICSVDTSRYDSRVKNKRYFRTDVRWYGSGLILFGVTQDLWESDRIEIIGNIHDNPDLLSKIHKDA